MFPATDDDALQLWAAAFNAMGDWGIQYMTTPSSPWDRKEVYQITQVIKFPRDVLESRAGTCIELTLLMDAIAETYSVPTAVFLKRGHAIPMIQLPESGNWIPIESTMVGNANAKDALKSAANEVLDTMASEPYIIMNVESWWQYGVIPPE
jgi:hypothetical protein